MFDWKDWKVTPVGQSNDLPSSCCKERYAHADCGKDLLHHPDNADHQLTDIIHTKVN